MTGAYPGSKTVELAQIGMGVTASVLAQPVRILSVWGADTSQGALVECLVTRPIASGTERPLE